jgi:hypothetical protein
MHQPLPDESLILTASSTRLLDPTLRRALGVLDARLEDELARYRRYRKGMRMAPSAATALRRSMATAPAAAPLQLPTPAKPVAPTAKLVAAPMAPPIADEDVTVDQTPLPGAPPLPPRTPHSFQNNPPQPNNQVQPPIAATSALAVAAVDSTADPDRLISAEDLPQFGFITDSQFATDAPAPNDYLASSEELLRSLAEEEATVAAERSVLEGLLTPFGVGSMLLMLLGSGMFGYLIMNPASLNAVKSLAMKVASFRSSPAPGQPTVAAVDVDGGGSGTSAGWMANSPALDSNEFLSLSLGNISALRTRPGGMTMMPQVPIGGLQLPPIDGKADANKATKPAGPAQPGSGITSFTPLNIKPITPPAPAIAQSGAPASSNPGIFSGAPVRIAPPATPARSYEPPAPRYEAPAPAPARSYEPAYTAPAPRAPRYEAPPEQVKVLPPPPSPIAQPAPEAMPQPQGDYRVVTPYTNDADLEAAQKSNPNASFRNMDDGAYVQHDRYGSKAEADAKAAELRGKGISAEVK